MDEFFSSIVNSDMFYIPGCQLHDLEVNCMYMYYIYLSWIFM